METSATGGDSHVWVKGDSTYIGPRRVIPLSRASLMYSGFKEKLRRNKVSKGYLCENIQITRFFVRTGFKPIELNAGEREIYRYIEDQPVSFGDLLIALKKRPSPLMLDSLIQKRLIQAIGFTPTDALHVLGEYTEWDVEAARIGASMLGRTFKQSPEAFSDEIKRKVARNIAEDLMAYLVEGMPRNEIDRVLPGKNFTQFSIGIPVVLLGGPVKAYVENLRKLVNADFRVPEHADVGNAVGSLVGKGIKRVEILIKTRVIPKLGENEAGDEEYETKDEKSGTYDSCTVEEGLHYENKSEFMVFSPTERKKFEGYNEALEFAEKLGKQLVMDYMINAGLGKEDIRIDVSRKHLSPRGWMDVPLETKLIFVGIGTPKNTGMA
jgi:N-methylhydantoinase A/oxoprolinase/acetone carboxylase beta subunit